MRRVLAVAMLGTGTLAAQGHPVPERFTLEASHSVASFSVRHLGLARVRGHFSDLAGTLLYDEAEPANSSVTVIIRTASLSTGHERRDADLRENFFEVARYPHIVFQSTSVTPRDGGLVLAGTLRIRDVTRAVVIPVTLLGMRDEAAERRAGFSGTLRIDRNDFGVRKEGHPAETRLVIGNEIEIELEVEAVRQRFAAVAFDSRQKPSVGALLDTVVQRSGGAAAARRLRDLRAARDATYNGASRELIVLAARLIESGRPDAAAAILGAAVESDTSLAPQLWLGHAYAAAGDVPRARQSYERVLGRDSVSTGAIEMLRRLR